MPKQEPGERVRNFDEVALGYTPELARRGGRRAAWPARSPAASTAARWASTSRLSSTASPRATSRPASRSSRRPTRCRRSAAASARRRSSARSSACWARRASRVAIGRLERFLADWEAAQGAAEPPPHAARQRPARRRGRLGPGRHHGGRRPRPAGLQGDHVRGAARGGRRAHLRHPRVPPAQGHRAPRGRVRAQPGRRAAP